MGYPLATEFPRTRAPRQTPNPKTLDLVFAVEGQVRSARSRAKKRRPPGAAKGPIEGSAAVVSARAHLPPTQPSLLRCYRRDLFVKILPPREACNGALLAPES